MYEPVLRFRVTPLKRHYETVIRRLGRDVQVDSMMEKDDGSIFGDLPLVAFDQKKCFIPKVLQSQMVERLSFILSVTEHSDDENNPCCFATTVCGLSGKKLLYYRLCNHTTSFAPLAYFTAQGSVVVVTSQEKTLEIVKHSINAIDGFVSIITEKLWQGTLELLAVDRRYSHYLAAATAAHDRLQGEVEFEYRHEPYYGEPLVGRVE